MVSKRSGFSNKLRRKKILSQILKMKRVTERADLASKQVPEYISGCRQFEGEDLNYRNRVNFNNSIQKEWVQQQT